MNRCDIAEKNGAPFWPGISGGRKYFTTSSEFFGRYDFLVRLIQKAIPEHFSSCLKQKISIIQSKQELISHLDQFENAISNKRRGEFSCFIFDSTCTYLVEMHYGNPKKPKKYQEICFYIGPLLSPGEMRLEKDGEVCPSRCPSELPLDLDEAEEFSDDELDCLFDFQDPEREYDEVSDDYFTLYERDVTVEDRSEYNFNVSVLPSLDRIKMLSSLNVKVGSPRHHRQICGRVSNPRESSNYAIEKLFNLINECRLSGHHDEGEVLSNESLCDLYPVCN